MAKNNILSQFDEDTADFDIDSFFNQLFNTIQSYKSILSLQENVVIENPVDNSSSKNSESNLNTFYRILGLPAVRGDISSLPDVSKTRDILSQYNTLNYFDNFTIDGKSAAASAAARENAFYQKMTFEKSVNVIKDPLPFSAAVDLNNSRRASIFPMVVHAAIPIFPIQRRTAPLFFDGDFILFGNQSRLSRPFIEHIVYMRTKKFSGFEDYEPALRAQISKELQGTDLENQVLQNFNKFELLTFRIVSKLLRALKRCASSFRRVEENIQFLQKDVLFLPAPKSNPAERAGNLPIDLVEDTVSINITENGLEAIIKELQAAIADEDLLIALLPSNLVKSADRIKRTEDILRNSNVPNDALLAEFNFITNYDSVAYKKILKEIESKKAKLLSDFEENRKNLIYLNGETTGLSIFDVICILLALFTIDLGSLLAIINKDSLNNLSKSDLYYRRNSGEVSPTQSTNIFEDIGPAILGATNANVAASLKNIQDKVKEYFKLAEKFYELEASSGPNRS